MGTALFTGVTGLKAQQVKLDVIASNIANVNTTGYRASRVLFQDLFSQTIRGGSAPVAAFGGANPAQVGLGVQLASIDVSHEQGALLTTGISSDLAVQGNGFFVLNDGSGRSYTRDGSFQLNSNGVLIDPATGRRVQGFLADEQGNIDTDGLLRDIFLPVGATGIVRATTIATMIGNLNSDVSPPAPGDPANVVRSIEVFDSLGTAREVRIEFTKQGPPADPNTWNWEATFDGTVVGGGTLEFGPEGTLPPNSIGAVSIPAALLNTTESEPIDPFAFNVDFSGITQLSTGFNDATGDPLPSDVTLRNQDGFERGILQSFNIGANGEINGVFTNGLTRTIAQVALATFSNVGGLSRNGDNGFISTPASGSAQIGPPGTGGRGSVVGGVLENSNVDLGQEFSNLIITQRAFQANARSITAADTLLQETVNLIR